MKLIKMLGLAAVAAMAAMAIVGASSASAETGNIVLCAKLILKCTNTADQAGEGGNVTITASATNPELKSSIGTVKCASSKSVVTLLNKLGLSITGHVLELSFSECFLGKTECKVKTEELGALLFKHHPENPLEAIVEATLLEGKDTLQRLTCGALINCVYSGEGAALTAHSSMEGLTQLLAKEAILSKTSGLCPETSKWTATYVDSMATGLWIES